MMIPGSAEFTESIRARISNNATEVMQSVAPYSYLLLNNSTKTIVAYSTRWTLVDSSGKTTTYDAIYWNLQTFQGGDAISSREIRLVTPLFRFGMNGGASGASLQSKVRDLISTFDNKKEIQVSLETIIYDDGSAFGPDSNRAVLRAQSYLEAERYVLQTYLEKPDWGWLELLAAQKEVILENPPTYEQALGFAKRNAAARVLMAKRSGVDDATLRTSLEKRPILSIK